jgi:hypothetical protein
LGDIGNNMGYYKIGLGSHEAILCFVFVLASFFMIIHMLNMLVAIMGNTFAVNLEVSDLVLMKIKLKFVIDTWWMDAIGDEKAKIQYVIAALLVKDDSPDAK